MAVPFLVVFLADHPRPTRRQGSGGGPPPQDLRTAGQPRSNHSTSYPSTSKPSPRLSDDTAKVAACASGTRCSGQTEAAARYQARDTPAAILPAVHVALQVAAHAGPSSCLVGAF